ncbi:MAG: MMPL family transporter [Thermodesulfobacteriota bacterium]
MTWIHKSFEGWFIRMASLVCRHKYWSLMLMLGLTFALAAQLPKTTIDTRDESFFYKDDPALVSYNNFRDQFGTDDAFIITLRPKKGLDRRFFTFLSLLHHELEAKVPYLDEISSLVNARLVRAEGDTLVVEDLLADLPKSAAGTARILELIDHYPMYDKLLISEDRSLVSIMIRAQAIRELPESELLAGFDDAMIDTRKDSEKYLSNSESTEITKAIKEVLDRYRDEEIEIFFSGTPAVIAELQASIEKDLRTLVPLAALLILTFLALLFRRVSGVVYPTLVVFLSLFSTLGFMALVNIPITMLTQMLPSFLLIVGVGDSVHIMTIFYRIYRKTGDKESAIVDAVGFAGLPVLMTSLTTSCGLMSFVWADVASVAQLGYVAPLGVMLAFLYTVILLPALICIFPVKPGIPVPEHEIPVADRIFSWIARLTTHRPFLVTGISSLLVLVAIFSASSVRFSHNGLTWFPHDSDIRTSTRLMDTVNGGSVMLEVLIDTGKDNSLHDPNVLKSFAKASTEVPKIELHGIRAAKAWSLADVVKETNRALHEDRNEAYTIPESRQLIAQELVLFEASGSDDLEDFTDMSYRTGRMSILAPFEDAILYKDYADELRDYFGQKFPGAEITLTGKIPLFVKLIKNIITSMAKSYVFALLVITILMIFMVGRVKIGLMSMIANVVPIIGVLGLMGLKGIPLDLSTMLVGSLILGLVVDDTIHFLHHFRRAFDQTGELETAVRMTLYSTGRALVITSMVLCGGYFIYLLAYLESNVRFGLLTGCAVLFALAADFFLVPALLTITYRKKAPIGGE